MDGITCVRLVRFFGHARTAAVAVLAVLSTTAATPLTTGAKGGLEQLDDVEFVQTRLKSGATSALNTQLSQLVQNVQQLGSLERTERQISIDALIQSIEQEIEPAIRADKDDIQTRIDKAVVDLTLKTQVAVDLKKGTDAKDSVLLSCREEEKVAMEDSAKELDVVLKSRDMATKKCDEQSAAKTVQWTLMQANGSCDMKHQANCTPQPLLEELEELKQRVGLSRKIYFEKKSACQTATSELQELLTAKVMDQMVADTFLHKKAECDGRQRHAVVSMCMYGHRLQEKCRAKETLLGLVDAARDESRRAQWEGVQSVKCLLAALKAESPAADPECTSKIDFLSDIGLVVVKEAKDVADQSAGFFSCNDGEAVTFSGYRWKTGETPADYIREIHAPKINLASIGSYPFSFCTPGPFASVSDTPPQPAVASPDIPSPREI